MAATHNRAICVEPVDSIRSVTPQRRIRNRIRRSIKMTTKQGSLSLLNDPVAQKMLQSAVPARFAYNWRDGTPRVVPIWFHWNGSEVVLGTPPDAPKMKVLQDGAKVALTIDSD